MIPKIIHLCWFSGDEYPLEIRVCLESWARVLPDYEVRLWTEADARAIGIPFINEALDDHRWAFAADAVRLYAVWSEGGIYMDSDIKVYKRFDNLIPSAQGDIFVTFNEASVQDHKDPRYGKFGLQAAFFMGTKGNTFCQEVLAYYRTNHYKNPDGSVNDKVIAPFIMSSVAERRGWVVDDREQDLGILHVYPTFYVAPCKRYRGNRKTFARHQVYGSWIRRTWTKKLEINLKHAYNVMKYALLKR